MLTTHPRAGAAATEGDDLLLVDELLAGVDDHQQDPTAHPRSTAGRRGVDIATLTRAWINEKGAPELLPFAQGAVDSLVEGIEEQTMRIEELEATKAGAPLAHIYLQELERIKFVLKSYLRVRLAKIERHCLWIVRDTSDSFLKLSDHEQAYAQRYMQLLEAHLQQSCLQDLPAKFQGLEDEGMVPRPDLDDAVFCRVREDIGEYQLEDNETIHMEAGNIYILRYRAIQTLLADRRVELM